MAETSAGDWEHRTAELERLRAELNDYTRALHRRAPCGLSAHACFDYLLPRKNDPTVRLNDWPRLLETTLAELDNARLLARQLQERSRAVMPLTITRCLGWPARSGRQPGTSVYRSSSARWLRRPPAPKRRPNELRTWLRCHGESVSRRQLQDLRALTESLSSPEPVGRPSPRRRGSNWQPTSTGGSPSFASAPQVRSRLGGYDESKLLALDLDALKAKWTLAQSSWSLLKWLRIGSVRRMLRTARQDQSRPEAAKLGEHLDDALRLRALTAELAAAAPVAQACLGTVWANGEPEPDAMARARTWGEALHARMLACAGDDLVWLGQLRQLLAALFSEGPSAYAAGTTIGLRLSRYREALDAFAATLERFAAEVKLRREIVDEAPDHLAAVRTLAERVSADWRQIREWCSWQKARRAAVGTGLAPVIAALELPDGATLEVPALFERSFRRALLFGLIEREPALRSSRP
jgi:hypothetical protein